MHIIGNILWVVGLFLSASWSVPATKLVALKPDYLYGHWILAISCAQLGQTARAQSALRSVLRIHPNFDRAFIEAVAEGNRRSGSPDDPPFNLLVWGGAPGDWEGRHPYQVARELNLPNVFFCGWLPHDLLSQGLNLADLLVVPSYHEAFGQVLLEAMAVRVPVLATRSGGPLDFVVDSGSEANGWFCDLDDVASLAETMLTALSDQTELRRRGQNALDLIRARYDWSSIAQLYLDVYETLADQR